MRTDDIVQAPRAAAYEVTEGMYLRNTRLNPTPVEERPTEELRVAMCPKSAGRVEVCKTCPGGCRFGREMVRKMDGNAIQTDPNEII